MTSFVVFPRELASLKLLFDALDYFSTFDSVQCVIKGLFAAPLGRRFLFMI